MGIARVGMNFTIDILKKKAATMVTIVDSNSGNGVEHSRKIGCFQGGLEKMTQNYKKVCCPSHSVSQEPFIM